MNRLAVPDEYTRREEMATFRVITRIQKTDISLQLNSISRQPRVLRARRVEGQRQREYEDTERGISNFRTFKCTRNPLSIRYLWILIDTYVFFTKN